MALWSAGVGRGTHADRPAPGPSGNTGRLYYETDTGHWFIDDGAAWAAADTTVAALGLVIGTNVQAHDADLDTLAGLTATTDNFVQSKSSAWASRTPTQVTADLIAVVGDTGGGGTKGLVPAPGAGDAAAGKFLKADGTFAAPSGTGASSSASYVTTQAESGLSAEVSLGALTTGILKHTVSAGVSTPATATEGTDYWKPGGTDVAVSDGGTGASTASSARTNLGLVISTDVQAHDADLDTIAGLTATTDSFLQAKSSAWTTRTIAQVLADLAIVTANTQTASYTLVLTDVGKVVEMNAAGANTLTIPPVSSVVWPVGTVLEIFQLGAGQTTLTPGSGVTIRSDGAKLKLTGQYASCSLRMRANDEWVAAGDLSS